MNSENQINSENRYKSGKIVPPGNTIGFPSRDPELDAYPCFVNPPPGYGEVAFYWWLGDKLEKERILWQLDRLKDSGVMGLQVNYAHSDKGGFSCGHTYPSEPPLFSEQWWELFNWFLKEAKKNNMAVSLSDYTLCSPGQGWYTDEVIAENPDLYGAQLDHIIGDIKDGTVCRMDIPENIINTTAYKINNGNVLPGTGIDLMMNIQGRYLEWTAPEGEWRIVVVYYKANPNSVDPMNPGTGKKIIEKFFQRFEDRNPGEGGHGLNFFFSDELTFGVSGNLWNDDFPEKFKKSKGYDIIPEIPALFVDIGPRTPKIRMDYRDVMVELEEEAYFKPVFDWHQKRGMIYGCDHGGRGKDVTEFGDYFRTQRWNQGPGNDQSFLHSDIIKNKVASSIAHLYERPRTWLEGYHSSGWGTSSAQVADATFRNFVSGHNLLTLHGLYYSTHGGWWEWAPPCNHFRMPYWEHMREFLKCSQRLCYILSQGVHRCDVAIMYPVAPVEAGLDGEKAVNTAFSVGGYLYDRGIDFDFMDYQSLERSEVRGGEIRIAGEAYRILILPAMKAIRFSAMDKALEFYRAGGLVIALGDLPEASDRTGCNDSKLESINSEIFGSKTWADSGTQELVMHRNPSGGAGVQAHTNDQTVHIINESFPRDFECVSKLPEGAVSWVMHRRIGPRDVYMLYGVQKGSECFFRTKGKTELWNPWTGESSKLFAVSETEDGTIIKTPLEANEPQIIVFNTGHMTVTDVHGRPETGHEETETILLDDEWEFELKPTMDNRWGDFRMPAFEGFIGAEARKFRYAPETDRNPGWQDPMLNDSKWKEITCSYGPYFYKLGPVGFDLDLKALEKELSQVGSIEETKPVSISGKHFYWKPYDFSMRWGVENQPGHQGYHGLKEVVTDEFIALGKHEITFSSYEYKKEGNGGRYYLWTSVHSNTTEEASVCKGGMEPSGIWLNGKEYGVSAGVLPLKAGCNILLLAYDKPGRSYFILESGDAPKDWEQTYPLSMQWYKKPGVYSFDVYPQRELPAGWYRFIAPPGLASMNICVYGSLQCWVDGVEAKAEKVIPNTDGLSQYKIVLPEPVRRCEMVAIRIEQIKGIYGGAALPEPIELQCKPGLIKPGDWSEIDGLRCYSGGAWYRKSFILATEKIPSKVIADLGEVVSSAEVYINGEKAGIKVAPPWKIDITNFVKPGLNQIEVLVYNTLANHYLTLPTKYRGSLRSGLIGPVRILY